MNEKMEISIIEFLQHLKYASYEYNYMYHEERENENGNKYKAKGYDSISWDILRTVEDSLAGNIREDIFEETSIYEIKEAIQKKFGNIMIKFVVNCLEAVDKRKHIIVSENEKRIKVEEEMMKELEEISGHKLNILSELDGLIMSYIPDVCKRERELTQEELNGLNKYIEKVKDRTMKEVVEMNSKLLKVFMEDTVDMVGVD